MKPFTISAESVQHNDCLTGLLVRQREKEDSVEVILLNCSSDKQQKHKLHSLSQIALYQYEDDEITVSPLTGSCRITGDGFEYAVDSGLVLLQNKENQIKLYAHPALPVRKLLDHAYRYCTRWIRLDI